MFGIGWTLLEGSRRLGQLMLLAAVACVVVCGASGAASASVAHPTAIKPIKIVLGKNPLTVSPVLDSARAASATIGSSGGTLKATTADGSKLVLKIPANALAGDQELTMTPLRSLGGSPFPLVAGVQLEPAGLVPLRAITLSVTPSSAVPLAQQVAFAYQSGGHQFGLVPLALARTLEIPVLEFGGLGFGRASAAQVAAQMARKPSVPQGAFLQQLVPYAYPLREQGIGAVAARKVAASGFDGAHILGILAGYYDTFVKPALNNADLNGQTASLAAGLGLGWDRQVQLLGAGEQFASQDAEITAAILKAIPKVWKQTIDKCNGGIGTIGNLRTAISLWRQLQLLGGTDDLLGGTDAIEAALAKCRQINWQVSLESAITTWGAPSQTAAGFAINSLQVDSSGGPAKLAPTAGAKDQPDNVITFQTQNVSVTETIVTYTIGSDIARVYDVSAPMVNTDPSVTYISFKALLTMPVNPFAFGPIPLSTLDVSTKGADEMTSILTSPVAPTIDYTAPTQAMHTISYITQAKPVRLNAQQLSGTFSRSFANPGGILLGSFSGNGTIAVKVTQ